MNKRWSAFLLAALLAVLSAMPAGAVSLAEGEHILWIDRLAQDPTLPEAVLELYDWLVAEGEKGADGALADPQKATFFQGNGFYGYELAVLKNEKPVRFPPVSGTEDRQKAAWDAIQKYMTDSGMQEQIQYIIDYALAVTHAYNRDHPEVFWVTGGMALMLPISYTYSADGTVDFTQHVMLCLYKENENIDVRQEAYRDPAKIRADLEKFNDAADAILADLPDGSRWEQLSYLNRYLTEHNSYRIGEPDPEARNPLNALVGCTDEQGPVCEGYARAMKVLCDRAGIPCVLVNGNAYYEKDGTPVPHMWNSVQMEDGKWYGLDVTWNDPAVRDENGSRIPGAVSGYEDESFFLTGSETVSDSLRFDESHKTVNDVTENGLHFVNGPALASDAYTDAPAENAVRVESEGTTVLCASFAEAAKAADGKKAVLTLLRDVSGVPAIPLSSGSEWTLDLGGFTLRGDTAEEDFLFTVRRDASLTIRDSSAEKNGRIFTTGKVFSAAGGTIRLEIQKKSIRT